MKTNLSTLFLYFYMCSCLCISEATKVEAAFKDQSSFRHTSEYQSLVIHGFTVLISPELTKHPKEKKTAIAEMTKQLRKIEEVLARNVLNQLQAKSIWMEWRYKPKGAACCHWGAGWLKANGYNPEKKGCIEINNAVNFVKWSQKFQPWMVMHELAHAYHQMLDSKTNKEIKKAYSNAVKSKIYEKVKHANGRQQRAYALNNHKEYFAELTEAYLGKNDFYPFNRVDLKKHDLAGYHLMEEIWNPTKKKHKDNTKL